MKKSDFFLSIDMKKLEIKFSLNFFSIDMKKSEKCFPNYYFLIDMKKSEYFFFTRPTLTNIFSSFYR